MPYNYGFDLDDLYFFKNQWNRVAKEEGNAGTGSSDLTEGLNSTKLIKDTLNRILNS